MRDGTSACLIGKYADVRVRWVKVANSSYPPVALESCMSIHERLYTRLWCDHESVSARFILFTRQKIIGYGYYDERKSTRI